MKNLITILIIIVAITAVAQSDVIEYDFGPAFNQTTLAPAIVAGHITASSFGHVFDGSPSFTDHSSNGQAYQIYGGWPGSTYSDYFFFTVTIQSGWSLDLVARCLWFDGKISSISGPFTGKVTYLVNGTETSLRDQIELGTSWYTYKSNTTPLPAGLTGTVEFRIYGKDAISGGSFSIDNVILSGTLVELPPPPPPAKPVENIDPQDSNNQYAYGENVGWINFEPAIEETGAVVSKEKLQGFIWAENIGWINLWPENYGGVFNDKDGTLSGYAWGENVGWINFDPDYGGVSIDRNGYFSGWAWGENIGWINFDNASLSNRGVEVCVINEWALAEFADQWLSSGPNLTADFKNDQKIDLKDFAILGGYWLDYCPGKVE